MDLEMYVYFNKQNNSTKRILNCLNQMLDIYVMEENAPNSVAIGYTYRFHDENAPFKGGRPRKYSIEDEEDIVKSVASGMSYGAIGRKYGLSRNTIRNIYLRRVGSQ